MKHKCLLVVLAKGLLTDEQHMLCLLLTGISQSMAVIVKKELKLPIQNANLQYFAKQIVSTLKKLLMIAKSVSH